MTKPEKTTAHSNLTTPEDASRSQSAVARENKGVIPANSHVRRLQSAAARNFGKSGSK